jgi:hypothetical protein
LFGRRDKIGMKNRITGGMSKEKYAKGKRKGDPPDSN